MKIVMGGDVHGDRNQMRWLMAKAQRVEADGVFILGDFGIWDHADGGSFTKGVAQDAESKGLKVWFLPGNHENYDLLEQWELDNSRDADGFVQVHGTDHLLYSPRGHRWGWEGVRFLSLGGAYSVDKDPRRINDWKIKQRAEGRRDNDRTLSLIERYSLTSDNVSWWPQEEITDEEAAAAASGGGVDIMLAHDKPRDSYLDWDRKDYPECLPNQDRLQLVVDAVKPHLYLHGHFHYAYYCHLPDTDTHIRALDCNPQDGGSRNLSWALLECAGGGYRLDWQDKRGEMHHTNFGLQAEDE